MSQRQTSNTCRHCGKYFEVDITKTRRLPHFCCPGCVKEHNKQSKHAHGQANSSSILPLKPINKSRKRRLCLMCGRMFVSDGPFNRRCKRCERNLQDTGYAESHSKMRLPFHAHGQEEMNDDDDEV